LSPRTLVGYEHDLKLWVKYAGDVDVSAVTTPEIRAYLAWLRTEYKPHRLSGADHPLSPKTIRNVWVALSSFFAWASTEFGWPDPIQGVSAASLRGGALLDSSSRIARCGCGRHGANSLFHKSSD